MELTVLNLIKKGAMLDLLFFFLELQFPDNNVDLNSTDGGRGNCLAVECGSGCKIVDHDCEAQLPHTCAGIMNKYATNCPSGSEHTSYYHNEYLLGKDNYLCYYKTSASWNDTLHSNSCPEDSYTNTAAIWEGFKAAAAVSYTALNKQVSHYWIGLGRYSCINESGKKLKFLFCPRNI